ncbi:MAG: hypothetical protein OHK0057_24170 [Thermoflexibacter sp.]
MYRFSFIWGSGLWLLLSIIGIVAGLIFSILGLSIILKGETKIGSIVGSLFGLLPLSLSIWLITRILKDTQESKLRAIERNIIGIAIQHGGKTTPLELTLKLALSMEEAQKELDLLTGKDIFELEVSEEGRVVYRLKETLLGENERTK